ncbi:hypothetical protein GCM10027406_20910 [Leifsonia lichenia]
MADFFGGDDTPSPSVAFAAISSPVRSPALGAVSFVVRRGVTGVRAVTGSVLSGRACSELTQLTYQDAREL